MKYVLAPTNAGEEQAMKSGAFPLPMLDTLLPLVQMRSIVAGVRLGLFPAIGQELRSVDDLARELSVDSECLELLLHVLACAGYVHCEGGRYGLTEVSRAGETSICSSTNTLIRASRTCAADSPGTMRQFTTARAL